MGLIKNTGGPFVHISMVRRINIFRNPIAMEERLYGLPHLS